MKPTNYLKLVMLTSPGFFFKEANLLSVRWSTKEKKSVLRYGPVELQRPVIKLKPKYLNYITYMCSLLYKVCCSGLWKHSCDNYSVAAKSVLNTRIIKKRGLKC